MDLERFENLLNKHHSRLRKKIHPLEIYQDIEGLTDFDKNSIRIGNQGSTYEGYDNLKEAIVRRGISTCHSFISTLKSHGYSHLEIVDGYDNITKSHRRFKTLQKSLFCIIPILVMILSGIITINLFFPTNTQTGTESRRITLLTDKGNNIEQVCSKLDDDEHMITNSPTDWKIKNLPLSTKENIDSLFNEEMEPPWKQLARIMQKQAYLVKKFERSINPARSFITHISDADNMTLSKLTLYLREIGHIRLVDFINENVAETDKERVISDIKGSVKLIWEIEIALNTASQPPWYPFAKDRNLSYGKISNIANQNKPASLFEEIDEMTVPEVAKYFKDFCSSRKKTYTTKTENDNEAKKSHLPTFSFFPNNDTEYVCELNVTDALKTHNTNLDLKIERMSYSESEVYYKLLNQKFMPAWMLIARRMSLSMSRIQEIGKSKNPANELLLYLSGDCRMTLANLKPLLLSVRQMWSYRIISGIKDPQQDKLIYDVKSEFMPEIEKRLNTRPTSILNKMAIEQGLTYGEIHEMELSENPAEKLKNIGQMTGRNVIDYVNKFCLQVDWNLNQKN